MKKFPPVPPLLNFLSGPHRLRRRGTQARLRHASAGQYSSLTSQIKTDVGYLCGGVPVHPGEQRRVGSGWRGCCAIEGIRWDGFGNSLEWVFWVDAGDFWLDYHRAFSLFSFYIRIQLVICPHSKRRDRFRQSRVRVKAISLFTGKMGRIPGSTSICEDFSGEKIGNSAHESEHISMPQSQR